MSTQLDVITIGEAMAMFVAKETGDLAAAESFVKRVAGAELNVATGLARLGLNVGWVSRVGNDSFGRYVLQQLAKERINSHGVTTDERYATGFQLKSKAENGFCGLSTTTRKSKQRRGGIIAMRQLPHRSSRRPRHRTHPFHGCSRIPTCLLYVGRGAWSCTAYCLCAATATGRGEAAACWWIQHGLLHSAWRTWRRLPLSSLSAPARRRL